VGEKAAHFRTEQKVIGNFPGPFYYSFFGWQFVKTSIDLGALKVV
jgi:hypothetical protein